MIIYPSIDKLLEKVPSRYSLAVLAAKRAHELESGDLKKLRLVMSSLILSLKCLSVMQKNWIARIRNERLIVLAV